MRRALRPSCYNGHSIFVVWFNIIDECDRSAQLSLTMNGYHTSLVRDGDNDDTIQLISVVSVRAFILYSI